jgi:hypothetical protein
MIMSGEGGRDRSQIGGSPGGTTRDSGLRETSLPRQDEALGQGEGLRHKCDAPPWVEARFYPAPVAAYLVS